MNDLRIWMRLAEALSYDQERMLKQHTMKQDRQQFRTKEQRRREKEANIYYPENDPYATPSRLVPKSQVGYKPFKWPMIRFGKFGSRSKVGFDAQMRREMGNITHEAGISCFQSMQVDDKYIILSHSGGSSWAVGFDESRLLYPWLNKMYPRYVKFKTTGQPMDIFLIRGHLVSAGYNRDWLETGADGEYLIDTRKPYKQTTLNPDQVMLGSRNEFSIENYYQQQQKHLDRQAEDSSEEEFDPNTADDDEERWLT